MRRMSMVSWLGWVMACAAPQIQESGFTGLWRTNFGPLRLAEQEGRVRGDYKAAGSGELAGEVDAEGRLHFRYQEAESEGEGWFDLDQDDRVLRGEWRPDGAKGWRPWIASRVLPVPKRIWLVVLEAHWERGLMEEPYSFGEMLQSYFRMETARHVRVRHRFFHDRKDFRRLCREVQFLAEPVVLLISSHGTDQGILVNNTVIGPDWIAGSLEGPSPVILLHLSGCNMMEGEVAGKILAGLPEGEQIPVSGYSTTVAWDTSAIADFLYLSLVLIRGMDPAQAVAQTHLLAPFTSEPAIEGSEVDSLGLKVLLPAAEKSR